MDAVVEHYPDWALTDSALVSVAELLRDYHRAAAGFDAAGWSWGRTPPARFVGGLVSHNDPNLDNVVFRDGRAVALAINYYRDHLLTLTVALSDDYGRPEPIVSADYQFRTVAVCSRADGASWTCREELLATVAKRHDVTAVDKLLELVLAEKQP